MERNIKVLEEFIDSIGEEYNVKMEKAALRDLIEETKIGIITIEDKYGNKEECKVSVYVDKTAPTVTVKALDVLQDSPL